MHRKLGSAGVSGFEDSVDNGMSFGGDDSTKN